MARPEEAEDGQVFRPLDEPKTSGGESLGIRISFWPTWRGQPELVRHVGRRLRYAVSDPDDPEATVSSIVLRVGEDEEVIDDIEDFETRVTADGLRRFSWIEIRARGPRGVAQVDLVTRPHPIPTDDESGAPPFRGVWITIIGPLGTVDEMNRIVSAAVARRTRKYSAASTRGPYRAGVVDWSCRRRVKTGPPAPGEKWAT